MIFHFYRKFYWVIKALIEAKKFLLFKFRHMPVVIYRKRVQKFIRSVSRIKNSELNYTNNLNYINDSNYVNDSNNILAWFDGHTHTPVESDICHINQIGYPNENIFNNNGFYNKI